MGYQKLVEENDADLRFFDLMREAEEAVKVRNEYRLEQIITESKLLRDNEMTEAGMLADVNHQIKELEEKLEYIKENTND
jgi:hypothetical protein